MKKFMTSLSKVFTSSDVCLLRDGFVLWAFWSVSCRSRVKH